MSDAAGYARGFAEGIEAAANWHQAEAMRLVAGAVVDLRHGRFEHGTEVLNRACDHALSIPAIRALAARRGSKVAPIMRTWITEKLAAAIDQEKEA